MNVNLDPVKGSRLNWELAFSPIKALGMVIFSHILSRTSRPDSGLAMALTTTVMSLWTFSWFSSCTPGDGSEFMSDGLLADVRSAVWNRTVMWGEPPGHGSCVRYPCSGVDGTDWLTCGGSEGKQFLQTRFTKLQVII